MKIVVGLSGGVDSSVAAYLLKQQGHDVVGLFMRNWNDASVTLEDECPWIEDSNDALMVAQKLGIPFQVIDMSELYKERIVDYMFEEYEKGRTPNPDVLCNREVKFDAFMDVALSLGAEKVATGHYAQLSSVEKDGETIYRLLAGNDNNKDQSYFLCQLSQDQLSKALFPIGHLTKPQVREIAKEIGLVTADKKDSQGLCFIGKVSLPEFLKQQLQPKEGEIVEIFRDFPGFNQPQPEFSSKQEELEYLSSKIKYQKSDGKVIGKHQGAQYYTIGQSKGLGIGGHKESCFVISRDMENNILFVGESHSFPGLYKKALKINNDEVKWIRKDLQLQNGESREVMARIRYRQPLQKATIYQFEDAFYIEFEEPQSAIAEGQFAAWYDGEETLGSGVIS
ncbi:tRNA 2-thiouridine(34) synthase MnmA [Elizabethkingia anophelis]|uniref:tRNA-specific 2-thiouridylase MnmA n=1 Tax=Elizabethkingia anophelis TaxID=1117645 RepID=A0A494J737_9FLAO|nr:MULTISPECIES: tRNA 2-thiouridine(34) synthase MnmA [Elizabethkingia]AQX49908.1 tRNA(5-methylaminomethyl-2-thiouridylate)-methyltransferase [Elizabethkingia anophelis]ELB0068351.1 tRNA 2-thiouridine(34) synthase MnmA [Elizabethkingia anophelis]ELB1893046.1 tRNA 2-thiouridine(34) synthase MnmA [Elizabethkingia anophelis]ELB1895144.1 tRNA 2-thiouridine(34) synthase MnmA [Elizabethkingia anophelis]KUF43992.1 tRNA(5-methylaminomethyl-2-thiouridylate)-methyltransferase [Elizabethkingia anophelis]